MFAVSKSRFIEPYIPPHLLMGAQTIEHRQPGPKQRNTTEFCGCLATVAATSRAASHRRSLQVFQVADKDAIRRQASSPRTLVAEMAPEFYNPYLPGTWS
jgi:hypothetical protein